MKNNIQISLFLNEDTHYKPNDLAYELNKQIEALDEPILLPENKGFPQEANAPILLFIKNSDIQFISNFYTITITFAGKKISELNNYIQKIMDVLEKLNINAYRIGYVVNMQQDSKDILKFKSKTIMNEKILKSEDFELSWLDFINVNGMNVNCWHRYYTNKQMNDKLNILYDINTKPEEKIEITKQFILKFINDSEKYIDEFEI